MAFCATGLLASPVHAAALPCNETTWIKAERSLVISGLDVVNDSRASQSGPWSFARVMTSALAVADGQAGSLAYQWLDQWRTLTSLNGFPVGPRSPGIILAEWPRRGGIAPELSQDLDLTKAPFRLLAIVFRPDLRSEAKPHGEGRFVFGATSGEQDKANMTVIFEFALPSVVTANGSMTWEKAIAGLSLEQDGQQYLQRLQQLTDLFLTPRDGHSHLAQVRTNEQLFAQGWDLREFHLTEGSAQLEQAPLANNPDISMNSGAGSPQLLAWVDASREQILHGDFEVPANLLAGSFLVLDDTFRWLAQTQELPEDVKMAFARGTCNGCHGTHTGTRFLHVEPRIKSRASRLSPFLKGELPKRAQALEKQVCGVSLP